MRLRGDADSQALRPTLWLHDIQLAQALLCLCTTCLDHSLVHVFLSKSGGGPLICKLLSSQSAFLAFWPFLAFLPLAGACRLLDLTPQECSGAGPTHSPRARDRSGIAGHGTRASCCCWVHGLAQSCAACELTPERDLTTPHAGRTDAFLLTPGMLDLLC